MTNPSPIEQDELIDLLRKATRINAPDPTDSSQRIVGFKLPAEVAWPDDQPAYDILARMLDALTILKAPVWEGWQPIETAPKDGTHVLAFGGGLERVEACYYCDRVGCWCCESCTLDDTDHEPQGYNRPTHFMPLPPPPTQEKLS